jgi:hypothetical protein
VTITTPSGPLCMRGVRQIIVEDEMNHPLIGRPVLDEMDFVASQHLDSVRDKFHMHDFSNISEELLENGKASLGRPINASAHARGHSRVILRTCPMCFHWRRNKNTKRREQTRPKALDEDQCDVQRSKMDDGAYDVLQLNVKFASLNEQFLF